MLDPFNNRLNPLTLRSYHNRNSSIINRIYIPLCNTVYISVNYYNLFLIKWGNIFQPPRTLLLETNCNTNIEIPWSSKKYFCVVSCVDFIPVTIVLTMIYGVLNKYCVCRIKHMTK